MQRVAHIEDKSAAGIMIIGKQHPARGHHVFSVMDTHRLLVGLQSRDQTARMISKLGPHR